MVCKQALLCLATLLCVVSTVSAIGSHRAIKFMNNKMYKGAKEYFDEYSKLGTAQMKYFSTKVDNFNASNEDTFPMRYIVDKTFYDPAKPGPILFYAGNEGAIEGFYNNSGFLTKTLAQEFGGFVVFAEHRFYGESVPPNGFEKENLKYLSVVQVMMDYVKLLEYVKELNPELQSQPAFLFGGSYGGMLAAWIRMKYPTHFQGAIASSAPILWFRGATNPSAYTEIASSVIKKMGGEACFNGHKYGFYDLQNVMYDATKYPMIKEVFNLCDDITKPEDVSTLIASISDMIGTMSMVNYPYPTNFVADLPAWPIKAACDKMALIPDVNETKPSNETGVFQFNNIQKLRESANLFYNNSGSMQCLNLTENDEGALDGQGWEIQTCNEFPMPQGDDPSQSCFTWNNWDEFQFTQDCKANYDLTPKYDWALDYFGGRDPSKDFKDYTNIVFANGDLDPWHGGGVNKNITANTIALYIKDSAHHLDLREPNPADPPSVTSARATEAAYIRKWIQEHAEKTKLIQ